jgi:hypothetical protein
MKSAHPKGYSIITTVLNDKILVKTEDISSCDNGEMTSSNYYKPLYNEQNIIISWKKNTKNITITINTRNIVYIETN